MIYVPHSHWKRLHVIRCGPEPSFLECEPPPPTDNACLVWIGRICEEKGVPLLVQAAQRLAQLQVPFELVLVGDGPLRPYIEAQIQVHGLVDRVSITGWASSQQVRDRILGSRAVVMPSFAEGLPVGLTLPTSRRWST